MTWIRRYKQKKKHISKISVDSNFLFTSYAWLCSVSLPHIDYCVELILIDKKMLSFHKEVISAKLLREKCATIRGVLQTDAINSNIDNFESALYIKSVSILKGTLDKCNTYLFLTNSREYFKLNQYRNFQLILPMHFHFMRYFVNPNKCVHRI